MMYNIATYGAIGDGKTNNAPFIQIAIDECSKTGGGMVYVPPGEYLSGTIHLRSNMTLCLEAGAKLISSIDQEDFERYSPPEYYSHQYDRCGLICAKGADNIAITGRGSIEGRDREFWTPMKSIGEGWNSTPPRYWAKEWRPMTILLEDCTNILIQDISICHSPVYSGWFINCSIMNFRGVSVLNDFYGPNTDGFHFSSCRQVHISGCHFLTGDDSLAIDSNNMNPAENITISHCTFETAVNALRVYTGLDPGLTGQEGYGHVKNISMTNCSIYNAAGVINVTAQNGLIEGLVFSDITLQMELEGTPIFLMTDRGRIKNVIIGNMTARTNGACTIIGTKEDYIEGVTLSNIRFALYPRRKMYGLEIPDPIPSYAQHHFAPYNLYIRYARDIKLRDISVEWFETDLEGAWSAIKCMNSEEISIEGFKGKQAGEGQPAILLENVKGASVYRCQAAKGTGTFLELKGFGSKEVLFTCNDTRKAARVFGAEQDTGDSGVAESED